MVVGSIWPIVAAAVASVLIGYGWYHPRAFGALWMRLSGVTPEMAERGGRRMHLYTVIGFLASALIAYFMNMIGSVLGVATVPAAAQFAFWCWLGFVVPTSAGIVLWDHKPITLYLINASFWLIVFVVMSVILVL